VGILLEEIKITGQVGGKVSDEELEYRFKTLLRQMKEGRGLFTFSEQLKAILDEVDKSSLASEMSYGSQLTELNQLTARISEVFVGLAKQNETDRIFRERQQDELMEKKDVAIANFKEQLDNLKRKLEQREIDFSEIEESHKKQEENLNNLKGRVDDQAKMIIFQDEQLQAKDQTIANQAQKIDSMSRAASQNEELKLSVTHLQEEVTSLREKQEREKQQWEFDFERQLFAKERELQQSFQERIEKIRDDMNDKYEERLSSIIDKHDNRVVALNQEISSLKGENQQRARKEEDLVKEVESLKKQAQQWEEREKELQKEIERLTKKDNRNSK
jgi:chromosome segregation ATPase